MEERELGLRDREVTLMDAMRRADAEDRRFNQVMNLAQGFTQLESNERQRLGAAVADATKPLSDQLMTVNTALAMGDLNSDETERYEGLKNNLENQIANRVAETTTMFGEGLDYGPIIASLLRSAMPTGMGATASGLSEQQRSLLDMYAPQE
jgi:plasmid maintenance system killer protein